MIMKSEALRTVKIALSLISLGCLLATSAPSTAHAQRGYPPDSYPPQGYPPPGYPPSPRYPQATGYFDPKFTFSLFLGTRFGGRIAIDTPHVD
jgi:hypothetical protein